MNVVNVSVKMLKGHDSACRVCLCIYPQTAGPHQSAQIKCWHTAEAHPPFALNNWLLLHYWSTLIINTGWHMKGRAIDPHTHKHTRQMCEREREHGEQSDINTSISLSQTELSLLKTHTRTSRCQTQKHRKLPGTHKPNKATETLFIGTHRDYAVEEIRLETPAYKRVHTTGSVWTLQLWRFATLYQFWFLCHYYWQFF